MNPYRCYSWSKAVLKTSLFALFLVAGMAEPQSALATITVDNIPDPGLSGNVYALASMPTGKIIIGGDFGLWSGTGGQWSGIACLTSTGAVDTSFASQFVSNVNDIAIQADQKIVVAGDFYDSTGAIFHIGRLAASGAVDSTFTAPAGLDDVINTVVVLAGGKILIGGAFTTADGKGGHGYLARLNTNGTLDTLFDMKADGAVNKLVIQADGSVLVGGEFQTLGGAPHHGIARLTSAGVIDSTFNANAENGSVESLAVQADKKILVGGAFDTLCGQSRSFIGRLNPDGTLDAVFDPGADGDVTRLVARANGRILVTGNFYVLGGQECQYVAQLLPNGVFDTTFSVWADGAVDCIAVPTSGKIWLGGEFYSLSDAKNSVIVASIGSLTDSAPTVISGSSANLSGLTLSSGTLSPVFSASGTSYGIKAQTRTVNVTPVATDSNAFIQVRVNGGSYVSVGSNTASAELSLLASATNTIDVRVVAVNGTTTRTYTVKATRPKMTDANLSDLELSNGNALDQSFTSGSTTYSASVAYRNTAVIPTVEDPNATVAVAVNSGSFSAVLSGTQGGDLPLIGGTLNNILVRVTAEDGITQQVYTLAVTRLPTSDASLSTVTLFGGVLDNAFDPNNFSYNATAYVGSTALTPVTTDPNATVQVQLNGGAVFSVAPGSATAPLQLSDGENTIDVVVTAEDGQNQATYSLYVEYSSSPADGFNPQVSGTVNAVAVQPDGKIVFGGDFTSVAGQPRQRIARFNVDGTLDQAFNPSANDVVRCIAVQADGKILVGGDFLMLGGQNSTRIGRLNSDGTPDAQFAATANGPVNCLVVQPDDGKIVVGGDFSTLDKLNRSRIGRLNNGGDLDWTFQPVADSTVMCLALQADGQILVGGYFQNLGGLYSPYVGRLDANGNADSTFYPQADSAVTCIAEQPADGKILLGGHFASLGGYSCFGIGRVNADGSFDADLSQGQFFFPNCLILQADGGIVVGGVFSFNDFGSGSNFANIIRFNSDGTLDTGFNPGTDGPVNCLALQSNGKIVVGGGFTVLGGAPRQGIGRLEPIGNAGSDATLANLLLSSGTLSPQFNPGTTSYTATAQTGAITVTPIAGDSNALIQIRLNGGDYSVVTSGSATGPLLLNVGSNLIEVKVTPDDGSIPQTYTLAVSRDSIADANLSDLSLGNASLDQPFDSGTTSYTATVASWNTTVIPTVDDATATIALSVNGGTYTSIPSGSESNPLSLVSNTNNIILVKVTAESGAIKTYTIAITRQPSSNADLANLSLIDWTLTPAFNSGNTSYSAFVAGSNAIVTPIAADPDATVQVSVNGSAFVAVASGSQSKPQPMASGSSSTIIVRVTAETGDQQDYTISITRVHSTADQFNPGAESNNYNEGVYGIAVQGDGKILVGGAFKTLAGFACSNFGRLNGDGSLDSSFQPAFDSQAKCIAVQTDKKILVGGGFQTVNGLSRNGLVRLSGSGTLDSAFNPGIRTSSQFGQPSVNCIAVQTDGKILVGGVFDAVGVSQRYNLARLSGSGTLDSTFSPAADGEVYCMALQTDGKIVVGGAFNILGGQVLHYLARLNSNGTVDSTFQGTADSPVTTLAVQGDKKILVGGYFSQLNKQSRSGIGRLNADGTLDLNFNPGTDAQVSGLMVQPDGRILVGGDFNTLAGQPCGGIGRLWSNGMLESSFGGGVDGWVGCLARQADGRVIAGGWFTTLGGLPRTNIGRLVDDAPAAAPSSNNANLVTLLVSSGTLSPVFSGTSNKTYTATAATISNFSIMPTSQDPNALILAQLNGGGYAPVLSGSIGWPIKVGPNTVTIQVIAASGTSKTTTLTVSRVAMSDAYLAGLSLSDGILAPAFKPGVLAYSGTVSRSVTAATVLTDDYTATVQARVNGGAYQVLHSGSAGAPLALNSGSNSIEVKVTAEDARTVKTYALNITRVACQNANLSDFQLLGCPNAFASGTTASVFGSTVTVAPVCTDTNATIRIRVNEGAWGVMPRGTKNIPVPLDFGTANIVEVKVTAEDGLSENSYSYSITRLVAGCDPGFNAVMNSGVSCLALQRDGKILVGGESYVSGFPYAIQRLNVSGTADVAFNHGGSTGFNGAWDACLAVQADGKILAGGNFTWMCGQPRANVARLNADGSVDAAFNPGTDGNVNCVAVQPSGKILIGGEFTTVGGYSRQNLARLNANGTVDTTFNPGADNAVYCLAVQADGSFLAGGYFDQVGGKPIPKLARFAVSGTLDATFAPNPDGEVDCIAIQPDGSILVGGGFSTIAGETHNSLVRLWSDGTPDSGFTPDVTGSIATVAIQPNGKILLGGAFSAINSEPRENIARVNPDGTLDLNFDPGADYFVQSIVVQPDGKIVVGGYFSTLGGQPRQYLGRLVDSGTNAALSSLTVTGATLSPAFTGANTDYAIATTHSSITVKPVTADPAATVTLIVNGIDAIPVISGSLSTPLILTAGDNTVEVQVVAADGWTTTSYYVTTTLIVAPADVPVTNSNPTAATLNAAINGSANRSGTGTYYFQYGSTTAYGSKMPLQPQSIGSGITMISATLSGLTAGTIYHYRPVVTISGTAFYGDDQVFATTRGIPMDLVIAQGGAVPDFDGATYVASGLPAINYLGDYAFQATVSGPGIVATNNVGICVSTNSSLIPVVNTGDEAPGIGGIFTSLGDPVYNDYGQAAFLGGFKTWALSGTGVWMTGTDNIPAPVAVTSQPAPGFATARFGAFRKIALPNNGNVVFLADMVSGTGANPNAAAGQGIWGQDGNGNLSLIVCTGTSISAPGFTSGTSKVASILAFSGSAGQTRSFNNSGSVVFAVTFTDNKQGLFAAAPLPGGYSVSSIAQTGSVLPAGSGSTVAVAFGTPAVNDSDWLAFQAKVSGSNSGLWIVDGSANSTMLASTLGTAPGVFATIGDPYFNNSNAIAFSGTLKIGVAGVTAANASGIWASGTDNVLKLVAQASGTTQVPGCPGAKFLSFTQMALPDGSGIVFLANLTGSGATATNNLGLWAVDANGQMSLLIRKGDGLVINGVGKTVASLDFLGSTPEVSAQSRSFNSQGNLMVRVTFTDNTQAIYELWLR